MVLVFFQGHHQSPTLLKLLELFVLYFCSLALLRLDKGFSLFNIDAVASGPQSLGVVVVAQGAAQQTGQQR